jgi:hypothetical protein
MSGFLGLYRQDGASFDQRLLDGILRRLRFRGPDAQSIFVERDFACCFSFLEVSPGRQSSRQPVVLDGRYWLVADVRFDGRADSVADLAKHGPPPEENAMGEELLLQAWRLWGEACNESLEISASPFTTRPARCFGVCATLWEPGHSSIRTLEKFLRSATFPFWLMAMRPCVAMSIAAIVSELDWQRAKRYAAEVGACCIWNCNYPRVRWE